MVLGSTSPSRRPNPATVTCATCHTDQASGQADTQMGRASELPGNNPTLADHPKMTFKSAGYTYTVETRDGQSRYIVSDGTNSIAIPILWALGSQAQTWVLERNGKLFESQVSFYPSINGLDITTGRQSLASQEPRRSRRPPDRR